MLIYTLTVSRHQFLIALSRVLRRKLQLCCVKHAVWHYYAPFSVACEEDTRVHLGACSLLGHPLHDNLWCKVLKNYLKIQLQWIHFSWFCNFHFYPPGHRVVLCDFFQYLCFIQSLPLLKTLFILITSVKVTGPLWPATHSLSYYTVCFWVVVSTIAYSVGVWFAHVPFAVCHFPFTHLNPMLCEFRISVHLSLEQEQGKCVAGRGAATRRSYVKQQDSQFYSQMVLFWDSTLSV